MRSFFILSIFAFFFTFKIQAQEETQTTRPSSITKLSIPTPYDVFTTPVQASVEYPLRKRISLEHEIAYVFAIDFGALFTIDFNGSCKCKGYRIGTEIRRYFDYYKEDKKNPFLGLSLRFQQTFSDRTKTISRENGAYFQTAEVVLRNTIIEPSFSYGVNQRFGKRWMAEFKIGTGLRIISNKYLEVPEGASVRDNSPFHLFNSSDQDLNIRGIPLLNFKIGYLFSRI